MHWIFITPFPLGVVRWEILFSRVTPRLLFYVERKRRQTQTGGHNWYFGIEIKRAKVNLLFCAAGYFLKTISTLKWTVVLKGYHLQNLIFLFEAWQKYFVKTKSRSKLYHNMFRPTFTRTPSPLFCCRIRTFYPHNFQTICIKVS